METEGVVVMVAVAESAVEVVTEREPVVVSNKLLTREREERVMEPEVMVSSQPAKSAINNRERRDATINQSIQQI